MTLSPYQEFEQGRQRMGRRARARRLAVYFACILFCFGFWLCVLLVAL